MDEKTFEPTQEVVLISKADLGIDQMKAEYMPLTIAGLADKEGAKVVHTALAVVRGKRVAVEKKRKELKAASLTYGRNVDGEAKRLTALLVPIEHHLKAQESEVQKEKDEIKRLKEAEAQEKILRDREIAQSRVDDLAKYGVKVTFNAASWMANDEFATKLADAKVIYAAEEMRLKAEAEAEAAAAHQREKERVEAMQKLAYERAELQKQQRLAAEVATKQQIVLDKQRAELDEQKRAQQAESDRLADNARALAEVQAEQVRKAEHARFIAAEKANAEAAEKAVNAERARIALAEAEAAAALEAAKAEAARIESQRPAMEKMRAWADSIAFGQIPDECDNGLRLDLEAICEKCGTDCDDAIAITYGTAQASS